MKVPVEENDASEEEGMSRGWGGSVQSHRWSGKTLW